MFPSFVKATAARGRRLEHRGLDPREALALANALANSKWRRETLGRFLTPGVLLGFVVGISALQLTSRRRAPVAATDSDPSPLQQLLGAKPKGNERHHLVVEKLNDRLDMFKRTLDTATASSAVPKKKETPKVPAPAPATTPSAVATAPATTPSAAATAPATTPSAAAAAPATTPSAAATAPAATAPVGNKPPTQDNATATVTPAPAPAPPTAPAVDRPRVFLLNFHGDMFASQVGSLREEITALTLNASAARGDEVLLVLHSGGGTVTGYGLAAAQLDRIKRAGLKLTVCVDEVAASGGYMMASVADEIVAAPFAIIGSIGVVTVQPNFRSLLDKVGIEVNDVTAGKWKRTMVPYRDPTPEDRAKVQEDLNACLTEFKAHIKHHRPVVDIDEVATGETWSGREALSKRLIDSVGTSDDVLLAALKSNKDVYSVQYQKQKRHQIFGNWVPAGDKETIAGLENAVASVVMDALTRAASAYVGRGPDI